MCAHRNLLAHHRPKRKARTNNSSALIPRATMWLLLLLLLQRLLIISIHHRLTMWDICARNLFYTTHRRNIYTKFALYALFMLRSMRSNYLAATPKPPFRQRRGTAHIFFGEPNNGRRTIFHVYRSRTASHIKSLGCI